MCVYDLYIIPLPPVPSSLIPIVTMQHTSDDQWAVYLCFVCIFLQIFRDLRNILVADS